MILHTQHLERTSQRFHGPNVGISQCYRPPISNVSPSCLATAATNAESRSHKDAVGGSSAACNRSTRHRRQMVAKSRKQGGASALGPWLSQHMICVGGRCGIALAPFHRKKHEQQAASFLGEASEMEGIKATNFEQGLRRALSCSTSMPDSVLTIFLFTSVRRLEREGRHELAG